MDFRGYLVWIFAEIIPCGLDNALESQMVEINQILKTDVPSIPCFQIDGSSAPGPFGLLFEYTILN